MYRSVVLAKLLYVSSAWLGYDRHRIEDVIRHGVRATVQVCIRLMDQQQLNWWGR